MIRLFYAALLFSSFKTRQLIPPEPYLRLRSFYSHSEFTIAISIDQGIAKWRTMTWDQLPPFFIRFINCPLLNELPNALPIPLNCNSLHTYLLLENALPNGLTSDLPNALHLHALSDPISLASILSTCLPDRPPECPPLILLNAHLTYFPNGLSIVRPLIASLVLTLLWHCGDGAKADRRNAVVNDNADIFVSKNKTICVCR